LNNLLRTAIIFILLQILLLTGSPDLYSMQDSINIDNSGQMVDDGREFHPDPRKASMYSAVFPGLGQIYNRKYWKVPIVYAGFAGLGWYINFTNDQFVRYRNALNFRTDGNPDTVDEFADDLRYNQDVLVRFKDYYRRQRDLTFIFTTLFYALNIIDAAVDAHLFQFDVSEDLGMKISPSFQGGGLPLAGRPGYHAGMGIKFSVNF